MSLSPRLRPLWLRRTAWFAGLWAASVAALGVAAEVMRLFFHQILH